MFHAAGSNGHARRAIACALTLVSAAVLMQCAHRQPGTAEQPPLLPPPPAAETRVFSDCADCPEMVQVPGGTFRMGLADWWTEAAQLPAHTVTIRPFAIGLREVTRDEYAVFAETTGRPLHSCGHRLEDNGAARCLTWHDARAYAEWLSSRTGQPYRLPSESEWEYVARGSDIDGVSRFGVQDLFTGVWEWMADCFVPNYQGAPTDGSAWVPDLGCLPRVVRGSGRPRLWRSWFQENESDRRKRILLERWAATRKWQLAELTTSTTGVRVARILPDSPEL